ncbi:MAG: 2-C-methyl-D-erythritol 2,4-cyclodiphosphate synthase [Bacillota bacterium]|jgi:2-C-methyl-D-erythritol 2,4-cyclodiphosphate synthase
MRIGSGFDVHRLAEDRELILGGVRIPFEKGLLGHSDADVLVHALIDAILGALCLGDIGQLFPDSDEAYRGADSVKLLVSVVGFMEERGFEIGNADLTVIAERPKMAPHIAAMRRNIASALNTAEENVSVKATTTEKLGFTGREEGIAAFASVLLTEI